MKLLLKVSNCIDEFNRKIAVVAIWCTLLMIMISFGNAVLRRIGRSIGENLTFGTAMDLQWVLFGFMFMMLGGYAVLTDSNVRVDLVYSNLSDRSKSFVEISAAVFFMIPFSLLIIFMSWPMVVNAFSIWEESTLPGGIPPWIIKPIIPAGFVLVLLQSVSHVIKHTDFLINNNENPHVGTEKLEDK